MRVYNWFVGANANKNTCIKNITFIEIVFEHGIKPKKTSISTIVVLYSIEVFLLPSISFALPTLPFFCRFYQK